MSPPTGSLVEVMDVLNRSMTNPYAILQETLSQLQSAYKEHYLSSAQSCDGKDPQEFGRWLDKVSQLATICDKEPMEVALAIAKFGEMAKHACSIKATNSASAILISNFIEGVQNTYI